MNKMKYVIVGAGASGIFSAISIKEKDPTSEVILLDKNNKIGKKIYATGNGKCNIGNTKVDEFSYNNNFAYELINDKEINLYIEYLNAHHILLRKRENLLYPYSESAASVVEILEETLRKLGIKVLLNTEFKDYKTGDLITVICKDKEIECDKLIISTGGSSSPIFGTDGSIFNILRRHKYNIVPLLPSLCPLITSNVSKELDGVRAKGKVSLYEKDKIVYEENGEILFKKDGLSGVCIFNCSAFIARSKHKNYTIKIDLLCDCDKVIKIQDLPSLINQKLLTYLKKIYQNEDLIYRLRNLEFKVIDLYPFASSQVSSGGVSIDNIDKISFESKIEKNVYFTGEVIDVDGLCGGYNLMWCFISALKMVEKLWNTY